MCNVYILYMISVHDGRWIFTLHAAVLHATFHSMVYSTHHAIYIHTHPQTWPLGTKIQRMFVSQRINIFCLIYLPLHRPSKYRYICNHITTPYNNVPDYLNQTALLYLYIPTQKKKKKQRNRILVPTSPSIPTSSRRSTRSNTTEAKRVTEAGRTKRLIERRPKKLATVWVAILGTCCWKKQEVSWMIKIHPRCVFLVGWFFWYL